MMSEFSRENTAIQEQNESGPNYFAYYKHLVLDLFSKNGNRIIPFTEVDSAKYIGKSSGGVAEGSHSDDKDGKVNYSCGSGSYFTEAFGEGLSEFKKERLLATLKESVVSFNREADKTLDLILATLEIDSNLREKNAASDKDLSMSRNSKKRKANFAHSKDSGSNSNYVRQLDKMEENLEEYINVVVSNCRPMTRIEKHRLGKEIRKLPEKAFNRVLEILQPCNLSAKDVPESIFINLEEQDNIKLWRLYYYVELVVKADKL